MSSEVRIPRAEHNISRTRLSRAAVQTLYGLKDAGYDALLVGGGVRDLLVGLSPKDFDVATNAEPEQVAAVFRRSRIVGRRFRLAHVRFGPEVIEVATFRSAPRTPDESDGDDVDDELDIDCDDADAEIDLGSMRSTAANNGASSGDEDHLLDDSGRILRDNVYGSMEQDAFRRDFTVNALYYDIRDYAVVDFVGGMEDLRAKRLRLIGDPATRYREDPVRMLRAVRFATKLGFEIDEDSAAPILPLSASIVDVPPARLFDEVLKLFLNEHAEANFDGLCLHGLFDMMFPVVADALDSEQGDLADDMIRLGLRSTALRIKEDKPVTPGFLFAALLWVPVMQRAKKLSEKGQPWAQALARAADDVMAEQCGRVAIPRRFSGMQSEIWQLQSRFEFRRGKRPFRFMEHKRFRAAYDFLLLRTEAGDGDAELAQWWTDFQEATEDGRNQMIENVPAGTGGSGGNTRRRRRR